MWETHLVGFLCSAFGSRVFTTPHTQGDLVARGRMREVARPSCGLVSCGPAAPGRSTPERLSVWLCACASTSPSVQRMLRQLGSGKVRLHCNWRNQRDWSEEGPSQVKSWSNQRSAKAVGWPLRLAADLVRDSWSHRPKMQKSCSLPFRRMIREIRRLLNRRS